jgi:hypothetical protein
MTPAALRPAVNGAPARNVIVRGRSSQPWVRRSVRKRRAAGQSSSVIEYCTVAASSPAHPFFGVAVATTVQLVCSRHS